MMKKTKRWTISHNRRSSNRPSKRLAMMMTNILVKERNKNSNRVVLIKSHSLNPSKRAIRKENTKKDDRFSINTINL